MRLLEKQARLQERVEDYVDELADMFNLKVPFYPEVFWVGKKTRFEDMRLLEKYRATYDSLKISADCLYKKPNFIFLTETSGEDGMAEEVAHFLHQVNSNNSISGRNREEEEYFNVICEMLGFFGSLALGHDRQNPFVDWPDRFTEKEKFEEFAQMNKQLIEDEPEVYITTIIHHQGYTLGERLFYSHLSGETSSKQIRDLFRKKYEKPNSARAHFVDLRQKLWPIDTTQI